MCLSLNYKGEHVRIERRCFSTFLSRIIEIIIKFIFTEKINKIAIILINYFIASSSEEVN